MITDKQTILIVDDDEEIVFYLKEHFKSRNFEPIVTTSPLKVIDILKNFNIRLMLLDMKMSQMSGIEVLDKIKKEGVALPPTLVITGQLSRYQDQLVARQISLDDVIEKPFTMEAIQDRINKKLDTQILPSEVGSQYEDEIYKKNRCRLAFVEDEEDFLSYLEELFSERNYEIIIYKNGSEAYEGMKSNPPHIALVDIKLPGMQGDEIIEKLYKEPNSPYFIPISADNPGINNLEKRMKDCGCDEFLTKPIDIYTLIEKVKKIAVEKGLLG